MIYLIFMIFAIIMECLLSGPFLAYTNTEIVQGLVNHEAIRRFIYLLFAIFVLSAFFNALQTMCHTYYKKHVTMKLQSAILEHICRLKDYSAFHAGEIFAHIDQNAETC